MQSFCVTFCVIHNKVFELVGLNISKNKHKTTIHLKRTLFNFGYGVEEELYYKESIKPLIGAFVAILNRLFFA